MSRAIIAEAEACMADQGERKAGPPPRGSVRILCEEIGYPFDVRLERSDVLLGFVGELVGEVAGARHMAAKLAAKVGGRAPSQASEEVLALALRMAAAASADEALVLAEAVHELADELNPEEAYPTDHLIDMLSSCASAIRFGLERTAYGSRHAAEASGHVWKRVYGVSRFDRNSGEWSKQWARTKLQDAIVSLLPPTDRAPA